VFTAPSLKECLANAIGHLCPVCNAQPGSPCTSMATPLGLKAAERYNGSVPLPGAPTAAPHKPRMEMVRSAAKQIWEKTPEGQKELELKAQREAEWKRQNEVWAQRRREADEAEQKRKEATRQAQARKNKWKNNDEVSGTYKLRWQVHWSRRSEPGPPIDDGAEWFPFGTDSEGRTAWRRPVLRPNQASSENRDA
jgi:hypothetical protein